MMELFLQTRSVSMRITQQFNPHYLSFFKVENHLTHILTIHLSNRKATLRSKVVEKYANVIWIHFDSF